ncbi:hypothetical protein ABZP36_000170 [Zizania latifolia]
MAASGTSALRELLAGILQRSTPQSRAEKQASVGALPGSQRRASRRERGPSPAAGITEEGMDSSAMDGGDGVVVGGKREESSVEEEKAMTGRLHYHVGCHVGLIIPPWIVLAREVILS